MSAEPEFPQSLTLPVEGMHCASCVLRVERALSLFPSTTCVVWVTTQGFLPSGTDGLARINESIVRQAGARSTVHVADWAPLISEQSEVWHQPDRVHLTPEGSWGFARLMGDTVAMRCPLS